MEKALRIGLVNRGSRQWTGVGYPLSFFFFIFSKRTGAIEMHLVCLVLVASGVTNGIVVSSSTDVDRRAQSVESELTNISYIFPLEIYNLFFLFLLPFP